MKNSFRIVFNDLKRKYSSIETQTHTEEETQKVECFFGNFCSRWRFGEIVYRCPYYHKNDNEIGDLDPCLDGAWCCIYNCTKWHPPRLNSYLGERVHDKWCDVCAICNVDPILCGHDHNYWKEPIHIQVRDQIYQCQGIEWGVQCEEHVLNNWYCSKHVDWYKSITH